MARGPASPTADPPARRWHRPRPPIGLQHAPPERPGEAGDGPGRVPAALAAGERADVALEGRIGAPIAGASSVICGGMNYAAHAAESGSAPPTVPIIFYKAPNTVAGPFDAVAIPRGS